MEHQIVSREEWDAARKRYLLKEKEFTRARDRMSAELRDLPWVKIDKNYLFDGPRGKESLSDLFGGRTQLIVNHFMLGPGWKEGCVGCSFGADHAEAALLHVAHRDVSYVAISRAPLAEIEAFRARMGWHFKWVSSFGTDFNYDFRVSFRKEDIQNGKVYYNYQMLDFVSEDLQGTSVFYKDENGDIFQTYSSYARGGEPILGAYALLDITPKGRDERQGLIEWVRHHDRYDAGGSVAASGRYVAPEEKGPACHAEGKDR